MTLAFPPENGHFDNGFFRAKFKNHIWVNDKKSEKNPFYHFRELLSKMTI